MGGRDLKNSLASMRTYEIADDKACGRDVFAYLRRVKDSLSDPVLTDVDGSVKSVCEVFQQTSRADRITGRLNGAQSRTFFLFARRMAIVAMRTGVDAHVRFGLIALAM